MCILECWIVSLVFLGMSCYLIVWPDLMSSSSIQCKMHRLLNKVDFKPATLIFPAPYAETFMELMILHDKLKEPTRLLALMHRHAWLLPKNWVIQL